MYDRRSPALGAGPVLTRELLDSERKFVGAMQQFSFGRIEGLRIQNGEFVLDPWPTTVRTLKFGADQCGPAQGHSEEFKLKRQIVELIQFVRSVRAGEIRCLEIRHGVPFAVLVQSY
jgi:hypothetical protein